MHFILVIVEARVTPVFKALRFRSVARGHIPGMCAFMHPGNIQVQFK